jgi:hypothetical protein
MEKELTSLECAIINEIVRYNEKWYPFIRSHIPLLKVKSREYTGVGVYIYFEYITERVEIPICNVDSLILSSDQTLEIDTLSYGLNYELNLSKNRFDFLELVTNGENWDGKYNAFKFIKIPENI